MTTKSIIALIILYSIFMIALVISCFPEYFKNHENILKISQIIVFSYFLFFIISQFISFFRQFFVKNK